MDNILTFVDFLLSNGFTLLEDNKQLQFVTYEHDGLYVRIVGDPNGKRFIQLSRTNDHSWKGRYPMNLIRFLILKTQYKKDGPVDFKELSEFFIEYYKEIRAAFNHSNFPETEIALSDLKEESARARFGNI